MSIVIDLDLLVENVCLVFLVFSRVSGFIMTFPLTREWLPWSSRLIIALALTVTASSQLSTTVSCNSLSFSMVLMAAAELTTGILMGCVMVVFFSLFTLAGHMAGMQMALGLAEMSDPVNGISVTVVSRLYQVAAHMVFIMINGHLVVFVVLVESFRTLSLGYFRLVLERSTLLLEMTGWMLGAGFLMVLPIVICLLMVNLAFGFMTRAAPQMNLLTLGFPLSILTGLVLLSLNIIQLPSVLSEHLYEALRMLRQLTG